MRALHFCERAIEPEGNVVSGFRVYRWDGVGFAYLGHVGANVTSYTDTGLPCGNQQFYQVTAYNSSGESEPVGFLEVRASACGTLDPYPYLGYTGIELLDSTLDTLYDGVLDNGEYDQVVFYEFGRTRLSLSVSSSEAGDTSCTATTATSPMREKCATLRAM